MQDEAPRRPTPAEQWALLVLFTDTLGAVVAAAEQRKSDAGSR